MKGKCRITNLATGKLTNTDVGKAVFILALRNQAEHRDVLTAAAWEENL
jgi:hypothetical protein